MADKHITIQSSFIFFLYLIGCLILPKVHPFSKYEMFNRFPQVTNVFILKDNKDKIIPFSVYFDVTSDDLFQIQKSILVHDSFLDKLNRPISGICEEAGLTLHQYLLTHQIKHMMSDSFSINIYSFQYQNNSLKTHEKILYKGSAK